jgi:hypothetical protein
MYRADGPEAMKPIGETEFVNGVAAMSASGLYGDARACAGIIGHVDLTLLPTYIQVVGLLRAPPCLCCPDPPVPYLYRILAYLHNPCAP